MHESMRDEPSQFLLDALKGKCTIKEEEEEEDALFVFSKRECCSGLLIMLKMIPSVHKNFPF